MADLSTRPESCVISPTAVRWTREDCESFERAGVLTYRYELVEGVINRLGQNIAHANVVRLLIAWLFSAFTDTFVLVQTSIDVWPEDNPTSKPEPDAILLSVPAASLKHNPKPAEIRLLIEVADTTAAYDLSTKAGLYARAGVAEYWVVALPERKLYVHRQPQDGVYRDATAYAETDSVSSLAAPDKVVKVSQFLPACAVE
jgi:Uma2 family endonuclease